MTIENARRIFGISTTVKLFGHRLDSSFFSNLTDEEWAEIAHTANPGSEIHRKALEAIALAKVSAVSIAA